MNTADQRRDQVESFFDALPFTPDRFQREAVAAFVSGNSVVVTAPTGAGKTLIADAAVHVVIAEGARTFYTTPIKALSNQKFGDFRNRYGADTVGLLTGDNVVNGDAPVVVMTTEVLRNMIYSESVALDDVGLVILDEVHYLQDRYRGPVWEEVIIHLPRRIPIVALSATVANAEELTGWIEARRGPTSLVVETTRPVPLESQYLVKDRHRDGALELTPVFDRNGRANPAIVRMLRKGRGRRARFGGPRRLEVSIRLLAEGLLPAIYFIFSRAGCDQAAQTVAGAGLGLTDQAERQRIRVAAHSMTQHLGETDLVVLGYDNFLGNLEMGVAAHHAGLVPAFKETVEVLFAHGLVKLVFATETLSLGINMPARTVVLERLSKFDGEGHVPLRPGDYTQLTGRAGRRGIDTQGMAVVLHDSTMPFERVAAIAGQGSHPLRSSFQPNYNMVVNLVANYEQSRAEELLNASFAQFRDEARRREMTTRIEVRQQEATRFRAAAECDRGDLTEYLELTGGPKDTNQMLRDFVQNTFEGDVLRPTIDAGDYWVILARGYGASPRVLLLSREGETRRLRPEQISPAARKIGHMTLPFPVRSRETGYLRTVARLLRDWQPQDEAVGVDAVGGGHPVAACPKLDEHLECVKRANSAEKELCRLRRRFGSAPDGLVKRFRTILRLLERWGYTDGWRLTVKGERLRFVYNELDLLLAESVERGYLNDLEPPQLAAVATLFTYEPRRGDSGGGLPDMLTGEVAEQIWDLADDFAHEEDDLGLPVSRIPEPGFAQVAHDWTLGGELEDLFGEDDAAAGDFVRNCRQLLDLLRQLRDTYPQLGSAASSAVKTIDRGVVAAGGQA